MLTNLSHLPETQHKQLAALVTAIVKAIAPEKIICFGCRLNIMQDWGCFMTGNDYQDHTGAEYDLLIIPDADDKRADHEIIQIAEQQAEPLGCRVTGIVHKLASVNEAIEKGSRFFTTLLHKGVLLYNGSSLPFASPPAEGQPLTAKSRMEESWNKEYRMARQFYDMGTHCLTHQWYELCVFMLHQAVQHSCMALLRAITGYRSNTHNLARLLALTENFSLLPSIVFPTVSHEETELFNLLRNAYSDARYKDDYQVPPEKAAILAKRVGELLAISETLYREKLNSLKPEPIISFPLTVNDGKEENK